MQPTPPPPVLIVGAGPTGLFCALELTRLGVPVRILERKTERNPWSRALAIQARTLEVLAQSGVAPELVARGLQIHRTHLATGDTAPVMVELDHIRAQFRFLLIVPQNVTEEVLEAALKARGVEVERGVTLLELTEQPDAIEVKLQSAAGEETAQADWLIGCDGAHSTVREHLAIPFEGGDLEESFILADADFTTPWDDREPFIRFSDSGPLVLLPLPDGQWRLIAQVPAGEKGDPPSEESIRAVLDERRKEPLKLGKVSWASRFRVHRRIVPEFVHGRALLAGDAAHIHSPVGGQGMNLGLQDAHNLAWKLALIIRGMADPGLLASYHEERHGIAEDTLAWTTRATHIVTAEGWMGYARDFFLRLAAPTELMQKRISHLLSQTASAYHDSPLTSQGDVPWHGLESGDYAGFLPVRDQGETRTLNEFLTDHCHLLIAPSEPGESFRQSLEEKFGSVVRLVTDAKDGSFVLPSDSTSTARLIMVRPDGYIAAASLTMDFDWVARYFEKCVRVKPKT